MDPLSLTAGVIAVATLAWQSTKAAYDIVDGIAAAPNVIADSKRLLAQTKNTLDTLKDTLTTDTGTPSVLESVLQKINLNSTLDSVKHLCDDFTETLRGYTKHSTDSKCGRRDKLIVTFHGSKIARYNKQLGECQATISLVVGSINLIVSSHTSEDIERLGSRFTAQEGALITLEKRLLSIAETSQAMTLAELSDTAVSDSLAEQDLLARLQTVCKDAFTATKAKRTGQSFGDQQTDTQSIAMQGTVGAAHSGVEQSFGNQKTTGNSRAFQGVMDAGSFAAMFGK